MRTTPSQIPLYQDSAPARFPGISFAGRGMRSVFVFSAAAVLFVGTAMAMSLASAATLFRCRRFCSEVLGGWLGRTMLRVSGIRMEIHGRVADPEVQTVFVTNHTSTLDVFVLLALAIPRTRFFLWGGLRKFPPVAVIGHLTGVFFTPTQSRPDKRARCFQNAERVLRVTGESVLLSPEGMCVTSGGISRFNRGAFHLATSLQAPIVPLFIAIPRHMNPGRGYSLLPGVVHVYCNPPIPTTDWKLEDLERNKEVVRDLYVDWNERLRLP